MRGSITAHKSGWRVWVDAGADPITGRRRRLSRVVDGSRKDAERELTALLAEADGGRARSGAKRTFGEVVEAYLDHKTISVEATTAATYRAQVRYLPDRLWPCPCRSAALSGRPLRHHAHQDGAVFTHMLCQPRLPNS